MKVLHVSASDEGGGAARAALRVHRAIQRLEDGAWTSEMLVARRASDDQSTLLLEENVIARAGMNILRRALDQEVWLSASRNTVFRSPARVPTTALRRISAIRPDVVLLHWLGSRMLSVRQIGRLVAGGRPTAWVLHDSWAFCGAEHHPHGASDDRFSEGYRPYNRLEGEWGLDLNRRVWERKRRHWKNPIQLVAPSRWMADQASKAALSGDWPSTVIPNPIDVGWWSGTGRLEARTRLRLDPEAPVLLYGALGGDRDVLKGGDLLYTALEKLATHHAIRPGRPLEILTFGGRPGARRVGPHTVRSVGRLNDEELRLHYSAADVMVVPSRMESFGQTASEAIVCGTPVVAFRTGGLLDIVDDGVNGRFSEPFSPESLSEAIAWVLDSPERHERLSEAARATAARWEPNRVARCYANLFEEMLEG